MINRAWALYRASCCQFWWFTATHRPIRQYVEQVNRLLCGGVCWPGRKSEVDCGAFSFNLPMHCSEKDKELRRTSIFKVESKSWYVFFLVRPGCCLSLCITSFRRIIKPVQQTERSHWPSCKGYRQPLIANAGRKWANNLLEIFCPRKDQAPNDSNESRSSIRQLSWSVTLSKGR